MKSTQSLQVDTDVLLKLRMHLGLAASAHDVADAVSTAIAFWLDHQVAEAGGADAAATRGYQWKSLFLPEGTVLRSWSYGEHNYARVEGDQIMHLGRAVSPNQFAQSFARSTRNAWTDLYVRRPGDKRFTLACRLRQQLAEQATAAAQAPQPVRADPLSQSLSVLLSHIAAAVKPVVMMPPAAAPAPARDCTPAPGWTLPERRQYRYRLEDVAY